MRRRPPVLTGLVVLVVVVSGLSGGVSAWWPDGHIIGYEHGAINLAACILSSVAGRKMEVPIPDFEDAYQTQRVLEAAVLSARNRCWVKLSEVK